MMLFDVEAGIYMSFDSNVTGGHDCEAVARALHEPMQRQLQRAGCRVSRTFRYESIPIPQQAKGSVHGGAYACMSVIGYIRGQKYPPYAWTDPQRFGLDARVFVTTSMFNNSLALDVDDAGDCQT